jgi:acetyltransferase-like isoleucine patch superfamily enzyme
MFRPLSTTLSKLAMVCPGGASARPQLHRWRGVRIGGQAWLGLYVYIDELHPEALTIGKGCTIGIRTTIITHIYGGPRQPTANGQVVIEDDVFVGPHCVILPNVRIGAGSVIQAGTVVSRNVPPRTLWGGPAAGPLAEVTVPLSGDINYAVFLRGLRPHRTGAAAGAETASTGAPPNGLQT